MKCAICNGEFDQSSLSKVLEHEHTGLRTAGMNQGVLVGKTFREDESTNVDKIRYHHKDASFDVTYRNGNTYRYFDVPSIVFRQAVNAPSIGSFLSQTMKGEYRYSRVTL